MNPLKAFMEPASIAILGASKRPGSISALATGNLLQLGYEGKIYPVNPKGGELFGLKIYSNLLEIEKPVDLAVVYLPPSVIVDAMKECGFGNCTNHYECQAACPKGIDVKFIARLNREYLKALVF